MLNNLTGQYWLLDHGYFATFTLDYEEDRNETIIWQAMCLFKDVNIILYYFFVFLFSLSRSGFEHLGLRTGDEENMKSRGGQKGKHKGVGFLDEPRITLSADFLIECLTGMYFAVWVLPLGMVK